MKKAIIIMLSAIITTSAVAQSGNADEQAIRNVIATMEKGWTEKKGEVFASVFADAHDYIVWNGYYFPNMNVAGNAAAHQGLFSGVYRNYDVKFKIDKIKFLRNDLALVHVYGGGHEKGKTAEHPTVLMTMIMEKKEGAWKIISFHNMNLEAFEKKEIADHSPMPLNIMYAGWYKK